MPTRENVRDSFFATTSAISKGKTDSSGRVEGYPIMGRLGVMYEPSKPAAREFTSPSQRKVLSEKSKRRGLREVSSEYAAITARAEEILQLLGIRYEPIEWWVDDSMYMGGYDSGFRVYDSSFDHPRQMRPEEVLAHYGGMVESKKRRLKEYDDTEYEYGPFDGQQEICALCGQDIQYDEDGDVWRDRGNSTYCGVYMGTDEYGERNWVHPPAGTEHSPHDDYLESKKTKRK